MAYYYEEDAEKNEAVVYKLTKNGESLELDWYDSKTTLPILKYDSEKTEPYAVKLEKDFIFTIL